MTRVGGQSDLKAIHELQWREVITAEKCKRDRPTGGKAALATTCVCVRISGRNLFAKCVRIGKCSSQRVFKSRGTTVYSLQIQLCEFFIFFSLILLYLGCIGFIYVLMYSMKKYITFTIDFLPVLFSNTSTISIFLFCSVIAYWCSVLFNST